MAGDAFEIASGDVRLRVEGLGRTLRALSKAGADAADMRALMHTIGQLVADAAHPPRVTGRLAGSIRAGNGKTKAVVRAGGARVPYAGVVHYGWPAHRIEPNPFLTEALNDKRAAVLTELDKGLADLIRRNNL